MAGIERGEVGGAVGQPRLEKGTSQDENQVSSTSSSWRTAPPHAGAGVDVRRGSRSVRPQPSDSQYHTGMRWPHQSWREMHQSRMLSSHWT